MCLLFFFKDAWYSVTNTDPLQDSDEELAEEHRVDYRTPAISLVASFFFVDGITTSPQVAYSLFSTGRRDGG
jgi:hypothetical protein